MAPSRPFSSRSRGLLTLAALVILVAPAIAQATVVPAFLPGLFHAPAEPVAATASSDAATMGSWFGPFNATVPAVNLALTHGGEVVYYDGVEANESSQSPTDVTFFTFAPNASRSRAMNPVTQTVYNTTGDPIPDLFCSGTTIRPDGQVMSLGGSTWPVLPDSGVPVKGLNNTFLYNPQTRTWSHGPTMNLPRWYPSVLELANGSAIALSGVKNLSNPSTHNDRYEILSHGTWHVMKPKLQIAPGVVVPEDLGNAPGQRDVQLAIMNLPMYPHLFVVPSGPLRGQVLYTAAGDLWGPFGERPEEAVWGLDQALDPANGTWTIVGAGSQGVHHLGPSVPLMLDPANGYDLRVLSFGGTAERTGAATPAANILDTASVPLADTPVNPMHYARWSANGVLLPDGTVLAVGGGVYDNVLMYGQKDLGVLPAERFDPATGNWTVLANMSLARMYHSTAILLPSGKVLAAGHVPLPMFTYQMRHDIPTWAQIVQQKDEIYSPPYLFHGDLAQPRVKTAPQGQLNYGSSLTFTVENLTLAQDIASVILMHPGATTHTFDADQRGIVLNVTHVTTRNPQGNFEVTVQGPPNGAVAPPGYYMVFVNEKVTNPADNPSELFPSQAGFVHVGPMTS